MCSYHAPILPPLSPRDAKRRTHHLVRLIPFRNQLNSWFFSQHANMLCCIGLIELYRQQTVLYALVCSSDLKISHSGVCEGLKVLNENVAS